jgi:hypothetical protein
VRVIKETCVQVWLRHTVYNNRGQNPETGDEEEREFASENYGLT